ncbi:MAG: biotin synthase BioB [Alphaproteobacteria bacterium]|nr:biotin synthase BioB [Alphaproteobacteria bacterium]
MTRHDWTSEEVKGLFDLPLNDLLFRAASVHRQHFDPNAVQVSTLCSIKTGGCPEDCNYCSQSASFETPVKATKLMEHDTVLEAAKKAKEAGATRFCMGAAWRSPKGRDMEKVTALVRDVKALGLETCATLGMLDAHQALQLKEAGLDYYNHNIDTSEEHYKNIITTRTFKDRLDTLEAVRNVGMKVCSGGILGLGENETDRAEMLRTLANLPKHPESVPINQLMQVKGTPLEKEKPVDAVDFVRTIAVARILMPQSMVRLSAGREAMSDEMQAMCFFAGANSIFYGEKLLTTGNPDTEADQRLFAKLGIHPMPPENASEASAA